MSVPRRAPRSRAKRVLAAAGGVVLALVATEVVLRAIGHEPLHDAAGPMGLFEPDAVAGVRQAADFRGRHRHFEFDVPVRTDALGLRVPEDGVRPGGKPVVLSLGDSFAQGYGVAGSETYAARLERTLGVPVHNAGVASYGVRQMRAALARLAPEVEPDVVLFTFFFANDPIDDTGEPMTARGGLMMSPGLAAFIDARPVYTWALESSRLAASACVLWSRIAHGFVPPDPMQPPADPDAPPAPVGIELLMRERSPEAEARLAASGAAIEALVADVRALGATPVLVVVPLAWQVDDALWERMCAAHGIYAAPVDRGAIGTWSEGIAERLGIVCVDLTDGFRAAGVGADAFHPHNQHFNALGHRVAAERIAAELLERGLVEGPAR